MEEGLYSFFIFKKNLTIGYFRTQKERWLYQQQLLSLKKNLKNRIRNEHISKNVDKKIIVS